MIVHPDPDGKSGAIPDPWERGKEFAHSSPPTDAVVQGKIDGTKSWFNLRNRSLCMLFPSGVDELCFGGLVCLFPVFSWRRVWGIFALFFGFHKCQDGGRKAGVPRSIQAETGNKYAKIYTAVDVGL